MTELPATYYDGVSSQPVAVTLRLDEAGLLHVQGLPQPQAHPLAQVRISPRLGSTMRSISLPGGAKCETDDHVALAELTRAAGGGKLDGLVHRLESSWRTVLGATLALIAVVAAGVHWGIPVLAARMANSVPPALAYDIGQGTLATFDATILEPSELDSQRREQLEASFRGLAKHYPDLPLDLVFRRGMGPNAFALPDGTVIVTDELVELAKDNQEVLAVLCHEIGHVHHRHSLRMALESSTVVLLVSTYLGDVTQLTTLSAALPGVYAQARYSREHEAEADEFAYEQMKQSGIAPRHLASILRSLQKLAGPDAKGGLQYLASHPPTSERIQRFEK
jgi:Zn-dependent protease with chaperone function